MSDKLMEAVYDSLLGERIVPVPGVENAFAEESLCEKRYNEMQEAYQRLRIRLNKSGEAHDVEIIINALLSIQRELCYKMFHYGSMFSGSADSL